MAHSYPITNQVTVRKAFWITHPSLKRKPSFTQNDYPTDTRVAFCDFVEQLRRQERISPPLAQRSTL